MMNMNLCSLALSMALLGSSAPTLAAQAAPTIAVDSVAVEPGAQTFFVDVNVLDADTLVSWQFDLSFDAAVLELVSVDEGPLWSSLGPTVFSPGFTMPGLISMASDSFVGLDAAPPGSGTILTLGFRAQAAGSSVLHLQNAYLNGLDSGFGTVDGSVCAGLDSCVVSSVPAPAAWVLFAAGLPLLATRRRAARTRDGATASFIQQPGGNP